MSLHFPPRPSHTREIEQMVQVIASVVFERSAIYVSAPITSGKRFASLAYRNKADMNRDDLLRHVIEPNLRHAASIIERLRGDSTGPLIDPTAVDDFAGWSQDDYRHLWECVIRRYAHTIILIDDWHHSNGCAYEFLVAQRCGLVTRDERGSVISIEDGIDLIEHAVEESKGTAAPTAFLEQVVDALQELGSGDRREILSRV